MVGWLWIAVLIIAFVISAITTLQAYSYSGYYDENEGDDMDDNEELEYYDYHTGRWKVIPEPDPGSYGYGGGGSVAMMVPLFAIFFLIFFPWLAYALVRAVGGKSR